MNLSTAVVTPATLTPDISQKKISSEFYIGLQTTRSYPLAGFANGSVLSGTNQAAPCLFCNQSNSDVEIYYLDFATDANNWIRAYVHAGKELSHIVRAVKTVNGNFIDGQMLRF